MTQTKQDPDGKGQAEGVLTSLKGVSELENIDHQAGHQYLPVDVYFAPGTMEEHFHASSIRCRCKKIHQTTSRNTQYLLATCARSFKVRVLACPPSSIKFIALWRWDQGIGGRWCE